MESAAPAAIDSSGNLLSSSWEADPAQQILESSVGPERIKGRAQQDGRVESRVKGLVQPGHCLISVPKSDVDQRYIGIGRRV